MSNTILENALSIFCINNGNVYGICSSGYALKMAKLMQICNLNPLTLDFQSHT
jgi:hypothetical protein